MSNQQQRSGGGDGVYVHQGGFRIRNLSLSLDPTTGALASSMITELRSETFHHWLAIGRHASDDAERARRDATETDQGDGDAFARALEREFQASMVAVAAAAFAIDAFYASVVMHAPGTRVGAGSRDGSIFETLKSAFHLGRANERALREQVRLLFRMRDEAVHPPAAWVQPVRHPVFELGMDPRFITYRAENALNADHLARRLIWFCLRKPKPKHGELTAWCDTLRESVPEPPPLPDWAKSANTPPASPHGA